MNFLESLLGLNMVHALGWTLIHSIWQILFIGLFLKLLLSIKGHLSSSTRYWLSSFAFILIMMVSITTFLTYSKPIDPTFYSNTNFLQSETSEIQINNLDQSNLSSTSNQSLFLTTSRYISQYSNVIVFIWLIGLFIFYLRLIGGYWYTYQLKSRNLNILNNSWETRLNDLKIKLHINKVIRLAESSAIQIPMVIGHLKPIILLPVGMITTLPYNQLEAIFTHELAHIKRNDYLINLVKAFIEIIFFYHPVTWWISSMIDDERENCCDDLTIQSIGDTSSLQNALLNLQELNQQPTYIAAALFKNNYQLLKRIKRMKTTNLPRRNFRKNNQGKLSNLVGIFILLSGIIIFTIFPAFSPTSADLPVEFQDNKKQADFDLSNNETNNPGIQDSNQDIFVPFTIPDSTKKVEKDNDKDMDSDKNTDVDAYIDSDQDIDKAIDKDIDIVSDENIDKDTDEDIDKVQEKEMQVVQQEIEKAEIKMEVARKAYDKAMVEYHDVVSKSFDLKVMEEWSFAEEEYAKAMALAKLQHENMDIHIPEIEELIDMEAIEEQLKQLETQLEEIEMIEQMEIIDEEMLKEFQMIEKELAEQLEDLEVIQQLDFEGQLLETKIREELVKDGILDHKYDELFFELTNSTLEVNGKLLSAKQHQKYLNLYEDITDNKVAETTRVIIED